MNYLRIVYICSVLFYFICYAYGKGPILIKSEGKQKNGKELIMLNGCSPVLIRGNDKKHKQMIIAGGGDCGEKKHHVQYVPQYVPVPYYVHKPHYIHVPKYIHKHHYIRIPHLIVKKVPVPVHVPQYVPVPYEKKEIHLMYDKHHYNHGSHKYR